MIPSEITYTLLSDGSSDRALMPIIEWALLQLRPTLLIQGAWADLTQLKQPPKDLYDRIRTALRLQPCDILFIHRDTEKETRENRKDEIITATNLITHEYGPLPIVTVVPIRMMEAWLLINEQAIKTAAGNPNGRYRPILPNVKHLEKLPDPKAILREHLRQASGLKGRQLDKFNVGKAVHLVAENIVDFSSLKHLEAYQAFEQEVFITLNLLLGTVTV